MQQSTNTIRRAMRFECGEAANAGEQWFSRDLFCIEGEFGVWRRVPRSTSSIKLQREGAILAEFNGALIELMRFGEFEAELVQAGFTLRAETPDPPEPVRHAYTGLPPDAQLTSVLKKSIEQVNQQKQKAGV